MYIYTYICVCSVLNGVKFLAIKKNTKKKCCSESSLLRSQCRREGPLAPGREQREGAKISDVFHGISRGFLWKISHPPHIQQP